MFVVGLILTFIGVNQIKHEDAHKSGAANVEEHAATNQDLPVHTVGMQDDHQAHGDESHAEEHTEHAEASHGEEAHGEEEHAEGAVAVTTDLHGWQDYGQTYY